MFRMFQRFIVSLVFFGVVGTVGLSSNSVFAPETVSASTTSFKGGNVSVNSFDSHRYLTIKVTPNSKGYFEFNGEARIKYNNGKVKTVNFAVVGSGSATKTIATGTTKGGSVWVSGSGHQGRTTLLLIKDYSAKNSRPF